MAYLNNTIVGGSLRVINGLYADKISGDGSELTALNASNISSGTLAKERLATSGATAGSYGPSANASPAYGGTFSVPYLTVDTYGRVTAVSTKTITLPAIYTHPSYTARTGKPTANATPAFGGTFTVSQITSDATGHVTAATDRTITIPSAAATTSAAGLMSAADKTKLDGIATGANAYTHPSDGANTGSFGPSANASPAHGGTFSVPYVTVNAAGHVTAASTKTITLPTDNDTKNTAGSTNSTSKLFLIGATSQAANPQTYSSSKVYETDGALVAASFTGDLTGTASKATADASGNTITSTYATKTELAAVNKNTSRSIEYIIGTQTAATNAFTGVTEDSSLYDGKCINYYLPYAGTSSGDTLNLTLADGTTTTGAKNIYLIGTTKLTTQFGAGQVFMMTYSATNDAWYCGNYDSNSNTYDRTLHNNNVKAATAITAGTVIVGTSAGYKMAASGITFDISYPILYATAAIAANATNKATYDIMPGVNLATTKSGWTGTQYATVYLVGTLSGVTFTIDSAIFTTTVPTSADSKVYIPLGVMDTTTAVFFNPSKEIYQYTNGSFHQLDRNPAIINITRSGTTFTATKQDGSTFTFTHQDNKTTYSAATTSAAGLMSAADKTKLDGIATGANAYTHPSDGANTGSFGPSDNASPAHGGTFSVPYVTVNAAGHVTAASTKTITLPAAPTSVTSASKLTTGRAIDGVTFDGQAAITHYGTCSTAAGTAAKTVACTSYTLVTGSRIIVKFTVTNTAASPTLNVNSTGAKAIQYRGAAITAGYLAANRTYEFIYDGTNYQLVGDIDTNTTYSAATTSAAGLMSADDKTKLDGIATGANAYVHPSYTARTGKPTANATPAFGGTFTVSQITSDATGHVTGATDRTITIPSTTMTAATSSAAGTSGLVPAPSAGDQNKFLRGDGTWQTATGSSYTAMTAAEASTGTSTTARVISAKVLHDKIEEYDDDHVISDSEIIALWNELDDSGDNYY